MKIAAVFLSLFFASLSASASALVERDEVNKVLRVKARMIYSGKAMTEELAELSTREIRSMWNEPQARVKLDGDTYRVLFEVDYTTQKPVKLIYAEYCFYNFIRIETPENEFDHSQYQGLGSNKGVFFTTDNLGLSGTAAHEFGHGLFLDHNDTDQRDALIPGIMFPRGTWVKSRFQWDSGKKVGTLGGTLNPKYRVVREEDVQAIPFDQIRFDDHGVGCLWNGVAAKKTHWIRLELRRVGEFLENIFSF